MAQVRYPARVTAPEFPSNLEWLNTDHPLSLQELRGKVVLLDFWTFCCINCMHVIPDLKKLEAKYPNELVVIGVHSAKFATEKGTENIRAAILRYGLEHPVVNDKDFEIWNSYTANAWPTFMLIDPEGKVVGRHSGEGVFDALDGEIGNVIREYEGRGILNRTKLTFALEKDKTPESLLSFPGKITSNNAGTLLYISDSNHHRVIVVAIADGAVVDVIGEGKEGLKDGDYSSARFNKPQGVALDGDYLYVADTENHAIRRVDLKARTVTTLAGTGHQAREFNRAGNGTTVDLNSPWDLLVHNGKLYVAMAGPHQIWMLDLASLRAAPYAGSGREDIIDGPLRTAALAQPSGITTDGTKLYIADSEVSAVRSVDLAPAGKVHTIVGQGLFDFGDVDGIGDNVRLQHPIGIVFHDGMLYVADTYNNKIKRIDPARRKVETYIGTGKSGMDDGAAASATLNEPNGVAWAGGKLYITDTNNHLIRVFDPATHMLSSLQLKNVGKMVSGGTKEFRGDSVRLAEQHLASGTGRIDVRLQLPRGYKLNGEAPFYVGVHAADESVIHVAESDREQNIVNPSFPLHFPIRSGMGTTILNVDLVVYYCEAEKESLCLVRQMRLLVPVTVEDGKGASVINVEASIPQPGT